MNIQLLYLHYSIHLYPEKEQIEQGFIYFKYDLKKKHFYFSFGPDVNESRYIYATLIKL